MYYYLLSLIVLGTAPLAEAEELEPFQALQAYSSLITSGAGHITEYSVWDEFGLQRWLEVQRLLGSRAGRPIDDSRLFFIAFKEDKLRWEVVDTTQKSGTMYITDWRGVFVNGESKAVDYSRKLGEIVQSIGYINDSSPGPFNPSLDIRPSFLKVGIGEPITELLRGRSEWLGQLTVQRLGPEMLDGLPCERFRLSNNRALVDIWLSREHRYLPARIEVKRLDRQPSSLYNRFVFQYTYKLYEDGIWFIDRIDIQNLWSFDGKEELFSHRTIQVEDDFRINIDLPDDIFQIEFYKGQEVRVWQGRTYKVIRWGQE